VRDPASGRVTSATSGNVTEAWTYNEYGEVASKTSSFNGEAFFAIVYERGLLGRISQRTETVLGVTTVTEYEYDNAGQLVTVTEDGTLTESYSYDANGNRESALNSAGVANAAFDGQDRIISSGDFEYDFTDNGELQKKTNLVSGLVTSYVYDAVGNLIQVTLPSGDVVEYLVDAMRRRVGKKVNGVLERQWLWRGKLQPVAELDGAGNLVARFVYAGGVNVPELMVTPTATYRLLKDHLGSVRFVTNVATGAVVQEIRYDAWGRVLVDTNPGLQPFGFAGGLYDGETGLVRFGARDLDSQVARWTSKDPLTFTAGVNFYEYTRGDPVGGSDPSGLITGQCYQSIVRGCEEGCSAPFKGVCELACIALAVPDQEFGSGGYCPENENTAPDICDDVLPPVVPPLPDPGDDCEARVFACDACCVASFDGVEQNECIAECGDAYDLCLTAGGSPVLIGFICWR